MNRIDATLAVSGDAVAGVSCDCREHATVSVGAVAIRDGTNDYEQLVNHPSIEGRELVGDVSLPEIKVQAMTTEEIERILYL